MTIYDHPQIDVERVSVTNCLAQYLGAFAYASCTTMARKRAPLVLSFTNQTKANDGFRLFSKQSVLPIGTVAETVATSLEAQQMAAKLPSGVALDQLHCMAWDIAVPDGKTDRLALAMRRGIHAQDVTRDLRQDWLTLRQMCLTDVPEHRAKTAPTQIDEGWDVLDHIPVATLLLDARGVLKRCNRAGARLLDKQSVLRRGKGGIYTAHDNESGAFHNAVRACLGANTPRDTTVFLTLADSVHQTPVTLSRYLHGGRPTAYVLVTLPVPPSPRRIEALARKLGLNPSEARVAALLQMGHSNREAAEISGLKPQTFNTYAKRVFGKLNVKCRAEMAQMLTWQASGRGPT